MTDIGSVAVSDRAKGARITIGRRDRAVKQSLLPGMHHLWAGK